MCGIMAIHEADGRPTIYDLKAGLSVLHHRGPDGENAWQSKDGAVSLGHVRLSIIDHATGSQPIANEDGSIVCVVNGEFYEFEQIRNHLTGRGHRFRTDSDSEILLHLYEEMGIECLSRLRGEFAFVLWDSNQRCLWAARDRFGIKPLFFAERGATLIFGSEAKALHAAGVPAGWDEQGFLESMANIFPPTHTLFHGISVIPPGHYLVSKNGSWNIHRYWDFDFPVEADLRHRPVEQYVEEFRAILDDAVRVRMRADVPVGCFLSGGIDSCSVLALMTQYASRPIQAFSMSFDHPLFDEAPIARRMADHVGAEINFLPVSHAMLADDMSDALWHNENLFRNAGCAALFALSRNTRDSGYKVVLTGEGSDEILGGYAGVRQDMIRHTPGPDQASRLESLRSGSVTSGGIMFSPGAVEGIAAFNRAIGYTPSFVEAHKLRMDRFKQVLTIPYDTDELLSRIIDRVNVPNQLEGRHVINKSMYLGAFTVLQGYTLSAVGDRVQMAHSVEGRLPFLDHHVVEYTRTLPASMKIRGTQEKFVLREAMKGMLPDELANRPKYPFFAPPALLKAHEPLYVLLQDTLRGAAVTRVPFLSPKGVSRLLDDAEHLNESGKISAEFGLMMILSACLIAERFKL